MVELAKLLEQRNGFYAFESALHVFPLGSTTETMTLEQWNADSTWRNLYGPAIDGLTFFAEDVFGDQFAIAEDAIVSFNAETGEVTHVSETLEEWACAILTDYEYLTGYPLAHAWQNAFGPLRPDNRLTPKVPFVLGGAYDIANLYVVDGLAAMKFKAAVYRQIKDIPDGGQVKLVVDR